MKQTLDLLDQLIKQGQSAQAREQFLALRIADIPRADRVDFAQLARRLHLPNLILKLLAPFVRPLVKDHFRATTAEKALYAVGLTRLGAYQEAQKMLAHLDVKEFPQVYLFRAHLCIFRWDYKSSVPLLRNYIKTLTDPYQITVAKLNLAAAYFNSYDHEKFLPLVQELIAEVEQARMTLLLGNALELQSQYFIAVKNFAEAEKTLLRAEHVLKDSPSQYSFFVKKWRTILNVLAARGEDTPFEALKSLRAEAQSRKDWETLRECDFYHSVAVHDQLKFKNVFQGTPLPNYRKRMKRLFAPKNLRDKSVEWQVPLVTSAREIPNGNPIFYFDLAAGRPISETTNLESASLIQLPKVHKLLQILCTDFYRPVQIGEVFYHLYPDEFYSWETSAPRVLQLAKRLRWWLNEHDVPLTVVQDDSNLSLRASSPTIIRIQSARAIEHRSDGQWREFIQEHPQMTFAISDVEKILGVSPRSARRLVQWAKMQGFIQGGRGSGRKAYLILKTKSKAA